MPKRSTLITTLTIAIAFLALANAVVFYTAVVAFDIHSTAVLWTIGILLGFLLLSFVGSLFLGMYAYNIFTRVWYTVSAAWMGIFAYVFMSSFVYGIVVWLTAYFTSTTHLIIFGQILLVLSVLVGLYGIAHAMQIKIKEITVPLPHVPEAWKTRKLVWVSDVHLGQIHSAAFARKVVHAVNKLSPDIVFIGGDLFDGTKAPDSDMLIASFKDLKPVLGIYFIAGNHEEFSDMSQFRKAVQNAGMHILENTLTEIDGMQLIGADYKTNVKTEDFRDMLHTLNIDKDKPSILLKHEPKDIDIAEQAGVSFQISGHTHKEQQWPFTYLANIIYKGFGYGLAKCKDMQVYVSSGVGSWGPPLRVGSDSEIVLVHLK